MRCFAEELPGSNEAVVFGGGDMFSWQRFFPEIIVATLMYIY
jgi:hypothetical protein